MPRMIPCRTSLLPAAAASLSMALASPAGVAAAPPPQTLPISAQWCLPQTNAATSTSPVCIFLEVASTPQQQSFGLQLRPKLAPLRGMWFPYSTPTPARFWMHLTPQPLDMIFVRNQQVVMVVSDAAPCMRLPCRSYGPGVPVDGVLELAGGEAARLGITTGNQVVILPLATPLPASSR